MPEATPITAMDLPAGDYAIVEVLGHRTLIGRVAEIERFGTKMLQIEPLFGDVMLAPVLVGDGSLYQFTPCSAETAYARRPTRTYQLPGSVAATIPPLALPNNNELPSFLVDTDSDEATGCSDDALPGTADDWRGTEVHPDGCTCPDCVGY